MPSKKPKVSFVTHEMEKIGGKGRRFSVFVDMGDLPNGRVPWHFGGSGIKRVSHLVYIEKL